MKETIYDKKNDAVDVRNEMLGAKCESDGARYFMDKALGNAVEVKKNLKRFNDSKAKLEIILDEIKEMM